MILDLWLAILLASVFVFIVSSILHMCIPIHKSDYAQLPNEADVLEGMRSANVEPGEYMFPFCGEMKDLGTPEMVEKFENGPVGHLVVLPNGPFAMGKSLLQWFAMCVVVSFLTGYTASIGLEKGADAMPVFRLTFMVAFLAYGASSATNSIWKGVSWVVTSKFFFDGLMYALATAGTFAWLWPDK